MVVQYGWTSEQASRARSRRPTGHTVEQVRVRDQPQHRAFGLSFSPGLSADTISEHVSQREVTMQLSKAFALAFTVVSVLFVVLLLLSTGTLNARDADLASLTFAAAQTAKQQCINTCRARYRDCLSLKQIPSSECRGIYQDCTRYTCNAGPAGRPSWPGFPS